MFYFGLVSDHVKRGHLSLSLYENAISILSILWTEIKSYTILSLEIVTPYLLSDLHQATSHTTKHSRVWVTSSKSEQPSLHKTTL